MLQVRNVIRCFFLLVPCIAFCQEALPKGRSSGNGKRIACQDDRNVWVFQVEPRRQLLHKVCLAEETQLNDDGRLLAVRAQKGELRLFDCEAAKERWHYTDPDSANEQAPVTGVIFSPATPRLLFLGPQSGCILDTSDGRKLVSLDWAEASDWYNNAFSPDGRILFHGSSRGLQAYSAENAKLLKEFPTPTPTMMVHTRRTTIHALYNGGHLRIDYPSLAQLRPVYPAPQRRDDGVLSWRRGPKSFEVLNKGRVVFHRTPDCKISFWNECGGFMVSTSRRLVGLYADNGTEIPGGDRGFSNVPETHFGYVNLGGTVTGYDMRTGKALGSLKSLTIVYRSDHGGIVAVNSPEGVLVVDAHKSLKAGRLVVVGKPL